MNHEIEAKIKVPTLKPFETKLNELGGEFLRAIRQVDTYFMDTHKLLHKNDCGLRIRQQVTDEQTTSLVTFKGARKLGKFKSRPEFETGIDNVEMMENIFESLGYYKRLVVEKDRSMWLLDGCEVCLDELPGLGSFVEVEGPDETRISDVLAKLNLQNEPHIADSYAQLTELQSKLETLE